MKADGKITADLADRALTMLEIDRDGFDQWDKRIIEALIHKFNGGPVGLNSLAVAIGEEAGTLEEVNEPYLIMEGYIKRTPQGRVAHAERLSEARPETARRRAERVVWRDVAWRQLSGHASRGEFGASPSTSEKPCDARWHGARLNRMADRFFPDRPRRSSPSPN